MASSKQSRTRVTKDDSLAKEILHSLCHGHVDESQTCQMELKQLFFSLGSSVQQKFEQAITTFHQFLVNYKELFCITYVKNFYMIQPKTTLNLCPDHMTKTGCLRPDVCGGLHLCKYFVFNACRWSNEKCDYGHNFETPHNLTLLQQHLLSSLPPHHLRMILKLNNDNLRNPPLEVCPFYNIKKDCIKGNKCPSLHVCKYYIAQRCKFPSCKRSHDVKDAHNMKILERCGIPVDQSPKEILTQLRGIIGNDEPDCGARDSSQIKPESGGAYGGTNHSNLQRMQAMSISTPVLGDKETEICIFHLRGKCAYGERCRFHHRDKPYQWQYQNGDSWEDIDDNDTAERAFCSVEKIDCSVSILKLGKVPINFQKMTVKAKAGQDLEIRRLSSKSSVQKPDTYTYVTKWIWYWQDDEGKWRKYGDEFQDAVKSRPSKALVTQSAIEKAYIDGDKEFHFQTSAHHKYKLDFLTMRQCNLVYKTQRDVRRRPALIGWKEKQKACEHSAANSLSDDQPKTLMSTNVPEYWDISGARDESGVQYVELKDDGNDEYREIAAKFKAAMPGEHRILSITRIQNTEVYDAYDRKRKWMRKKSGNEPKELQLFHGTRENCLKAICEQGFDCRISGSRTGAAYGKGTYFGTTPRLASKYAEGEHLLVCRVLVGESCQGLSHYVRPPPKDPTRPNENFYDSCVNDTSRPLKYVIFKSEQAYPEYILKFKK